MKLSVICAACMALSALPAAADTPQPPEKEIIYRASLGRADDIKLLLKKGAPADETNDSGVPLIALAAARTDSQAVGAVAALVEGGANVNATDKQGQTALFYAAKNGNDGVVSYLLAHGANYYAMDLHGNYPRIIAHQAGHAKIVTLLDDYVREQTAKRQKEYEEYYKAVEDQYKAAQKKAAAPKTWPHPKSEPVPVTQPKAEQAKPEQAKPVPPDPGLEQARMALASELSYDACVFQYWSYCQSVHQGSPLSEKDIVDTVVAFKTKVEDDQKRLEGSGAAHELISRVTESAMKRVYNQLNVMPSNIERHEHGVGFKEDVQRRCELISLAWDADPPVEIAMPEESKGGGGIGGGGGGGGGIHTSPQPASSASYTPPPGAATPSGGSALKLTKPEFPAPDSPAQAYPAPGGGMPVSGLSKH